MSTRSKEKQKHPNRILFEGLLTRLDQPSDKPPNGSRGHRVILTKRAAEDSLHTLRDMPIGFKANWDGHDARLRCGVITEAWIVGDELWVSGSIFGRDFPEVARAISEPTSELGMSYELCDAHVADMRAAVWTLNRVTFTGAAILLAAKAAYRSTRVAIDAQATERIVLTGVVRIGRRSRPAADR